MTKFARTTSTLLALFLLAGCTAAAGGTDDQSGGSQVRDTGRGGATDTGAGDTTDPLDTTDLLDTTQPGSGEDGSGDLTDASTDTTGDTTPDAPPLDVDSDAVIDGGGVYDDATGDVAPNPELCPASAQVPTLCVAALASEDAARLCDGYDNDCDGEIDEGCICKQGEAQACFAGPPGRANVGACELGTQVCTTGNGTEHWGPCERGRGPTTEVCDGLDNDCNGCTDELFGCSPDVQCPGPGDPRVPDGRPFNDYALRGGDFFGGSARTWSWTITGGPCDAILPTPSYTLTGASSQNATFRPLLSGSYTVTLTVVDTDGAIFTCTWVVQIVGPGVRIEMCYPESTVSDLDLYLMGPGFTNPWYPSLTGTFTPSPNACSWANCEANIRGIDGRVNWGYPGSPLDACIGGPLGADWRLQGFCTNPRLDIDNNLSEGIGLPENINVDVPNNGDRFRVMVQNFTGTAAHPIVNIYCGGRLTASFGTAPDTITNFRGTRGSISVGAMWRVADVTATVDAAGVTTGCVVNAIHPPGSATGYYITNDDPSF
jgi:hypothetical protein